MIYFKWGFKLYLFIFFLLSRQTGPVLSVEPMPLKCSGTLSDLWLGSTPNTTSPRLPLTPFWMHQSVNFSPFTIHLRSHILPHVWDQCFLTRHSLSPRTLNSISHLGSAFRGVEAFYWLVLTLLLDFIGLLFRTITPLLLLCLLLMNTPFCKNGLWNSHPMSCAGGHCLSLLLNWCNLFSLLPDRRKYSSTNKPRGTIGSPKTMVI